MTIFNKKLSVIAMSLALLSACSTEEQLGEGQEVDLLITNGSVYTGDNAQAQQLDVAICQQVICGLYASGKHNVIAKKSLM